MPVQSLPIRSAEQRPARAIADGQVDRAGGPRGERDRDDLAAFAGDDEGPVPAFQTQMLDVGAGGLRYAKTVEGEQGDQSVLGRLAEPGGDQEGAGFVAVQGGGVRLVVQRGPPDRCGSFGRPSPTAGTFSVAALTGFLRIDPHEAPGRRCGWFRAAAR